MIPSNLFPNNSAPTAYRFSVPIVRNFQSRLLRNRGSAICYLRKAQSKSGRVASICILGILLLALRKLWRPSQNACESFFKGYAALRGIKIY
ncbi:MAG: hypothetical protein A2736_02540 [Candidatus Yanofskybacteria bacterium RIFCSPHIGHO2_01_FULL_41_27]|uniref:Uncharacterized protein n=2 Tax=Candidatus Yanofskyibacteriota TaxID=1752733 RepID=A0A1F8HVR9_9BACT|nr:MAG: hypothetical protein A2736_02540 [Candidatus Yanofskybacteria bacterium RIFCSPHIGHO2_01_FULL_41_27]OGN08984.1 MAG: hypothetical protein A3C64_00015 [Candidatus Yanofskybacteria bacterium RIFCSPHIGHO2_02_FULL_41_12]OGN20845.1 MAG: hypothetical protein A3B00_01520 [Candidatus Yanofskybacteria bacterium RIFCSPLOWO2_01_FULL_41_33]OGN41663.1 MAG: hypothetical protein A2606_01070 [Candidatus Yanofskybacteria bacterium RIFOXYD1_FULL_42_10]